MKKKAQSKRKTVGQISNELIVKTPESRDPIELQREMQSEYIDHLQQKIQEGLNKTSKNFFIVVITKKEPLMPNVLRNYFIFRHSCPTPDYDQAVYQYHRASGNLTLEWVIPDKETCLVLKENALIVHPDERTLRDCVLAFADGRIYWHAKKLNGEIPTHQTLIA